MATTFKEVFPAEIGRGSASLVVSSSTWYLEIILYGPDLRYNAQRVLWNEYYISHMRSVLRDSLKRLSAMLEDSDICNSKITMDLTDSLCIRLNDYDRNCVDLNHSHVLFRNEAEFNRLDGALLWCLQRAPALVKKCCLIDGVAEQSGISIQRDMSESRLRALIGYVSAYQEGRLPRSIIEEMYERKEEINVAFQIMENGATVDRDLWKLQYIKHQIDLYFQSIE